MTTEPKTLLSMAGAAHQPVSADKAALVLIDVQNEYLTGPLKLYGVEAAAAEVARSATAIRAGGGSVIHIRHRGAPGGAFDPEAARGQIITACAPLEGEAVIDKTLPNSFAKTALAATLERIAPERVIFAGFMTHMCVSATVRAALDLGFGPSVVLANACATRDLPGPTGEVVPASVLHQATLAALGDRFAFVVPDIKAALAD